MFLSLFIKKPSRIDALLMIMMLSLLVYSIAQRRMRLNMRKQEVTIPNQVNQEKSNPTLRWVFQCFEGINLLQYDNEIHLDGFDELRDKIIILIGGHALNLYKVKKLLRGLSMSVRTVHERYPFEKFGHLTSSAVKSVLLNYVNQ